MYSLDASRTLIERSRWVVSKPDLRALLNRENLTYKQIASIMGYGRNGAEPAHAQSTLSALLKNGTSTKGERVMRAARALNTSPYQFARPINCVDDEALARAVQAWVDPTGANRLRDHAIIMMCKALYDAGVEAPIAALERELGALLREHALQYAVADVQHEQSEDQAAAMRSWVIRVLQAYNAYTFIAAANGAGDKYAVDVTGLETNFESWVRPEYGSIVTADRVFATLGAASGCQRVIRTFVIDPNALPHNAGSRLSEVLKSQISAGIDVKIRLENKLEADLEYIADIAVIGDYALDLGFLESVYNSRQREAHIANLFIPRTDRRFNLIRRRVEWVRDSKESDLVLTRAEQISELLQHLSLEVPPT